MDEEQEESKSNLSEILLGILIATFVTNVLVIICLLTFCLIRRRKNNRTGADPSSGHQSPPETSDNLRETFHHPPAPHPSADTEGYHNSVVYTLPEPRRSNPPVRPPRTVDVPSTQPEPDFYIRSLRQVSNNMYGNGPYYSPRRDSVTSITATGSATSFDSGYLGSSPLVYYGRRYKITANVHAYDNQSYISDVGQFGKRKLTLSESQTISDV